VQSAELTIDLTEARLTLAGAAQRSAELFESVADSDQLVRRSRWTIGEVGAHLAIVPLGFVFACLDDYSAVEPYLRSGGTFTDRVSGVTAGTLEIEPMRDAKALAGLIRERVEQFLAATAEYGLDQTIGTPWYGEGVRLPVATATGMLAAEQLVHGWDVAATLGRPWSISDAEASLVIRAVSTLLPLAANPVTTAGQHATYGIAISGGGPRFTVIVKDGVVSFEPGIASRVDCHIGAAPVSFLLVAYGRISQWGPIAQFRLRAWGRRPWLAFRFADLFFNP
jgi:uncharacterized protein (TIGR03083 family)